MPEMREPRYPSVTDHAIVILAECGDDWETARNVAAIRYRFAATQRDVEYWRGVLVALTPAEGAQA